MAACERVLEGGVPHLELRNVLILTAAVCSLVADQFDEHDRPVRALVELAADTCAECARRVEDVSAECVEACRRAVAALRLQAGSA